MKHYSIEEIIKGIKRRNNDIFKYLYKEIYPSVHKYILNANGNDEDSKDIFQESLIILYRKVCQPGFKLDSSIKTFVFSICKNLWYQKSRSPEILNDNISVVSESIDEFMLYNESLMDEKEVSEHLKKSLLQKYFRKLDRFCQRILQMFYKGKSHKDISSKLKISSDLSRARKRECMNKLIKLISSDPEYRKYYGV